MHLFFIVFMKFAVLLCMHCCMCYVQMCVSVCDVMYVCVEAEDSFQVSAFVSPPCLETRSFAITSARLSSSKLRRLSCVLPAFFLEAVLPAFMWAPGNLDSVHRPVLYAPSCLLSVDCDVLPVAHLSKLMQQHLHQN